MIKENTSLLMRGLLLLLVGLGLSTQQLSAQGCAISTSTLSASNTTAQTITLAAPPQVIVSDITINSTDLIVDLNATLNITHTFPGDLEITLTHVNTGTSVTLTSNNGGGNDNVFQGTTFNDNAATRVVVNPTTGMGGIAAGNPVYSNGVVQAALIPEEPLAAFFGESVGGTWRLTISDDFTGDGGSLNSWSLDFVKAASIPASTSTTVASGTLNAAIPDNSFTGASNTVAVAGAQNYMTGATVTVTATHTNSSDLNFVLTGPNGQSIVLSTRRGSSGSATFAGGTTFDVDADPGNPAPQAATFAASNVVTDKTYTSGVNVPLLTPQQGFEKFFGTNPNGNWTLTASDSWAIGTGTLVSWSITVRGIPNVVCELAAAPDVTVGTDPGLATGSYTTTPPATVEPVAGVCTGAVVTVKVDNIAVPLNSVVSGLSIGTHNVVYTVTSACGTDTELVVVTVEDQEDPAFTNCPAGTLIYTLAPGACDYQFDLALVATDNVGFPGGATTASFEIHELLAPGNYSFPISITDAAGNGPVTCTVNVTVNPYPTPITSLICNDLVTVSLDESCTLEVNADQVLEGGPYHCYDDYIVEIDRTLPLGNGPWVPAVLGPGDVHKTYAVRVTDDTNGNDVADANEVKCWGNIAIEDKLPPVFETCGCTEGAVAVSSFTGTLDASDPTFNRPLSGAPCGLSGVGTNVFYETFTFTVETAGSYSFAESTPTDGFGALYAGSFDPSNPCANFVNSNDDGNGNLDFLITSTLAPGTYVLVVTTFSNAATGAYTVTVSPSVLSGPPSNCEFYCADKDGLLNGSIAAPLPVVTDNCSTPTVTKKDVFVEGGACEDDYIVRTWTATDAWGNSSQCTQTLNLIPYTLDDVEFPEDITIDCAGCGVTAGTEPCITGVPTVPGNNAAGEYGLITYNGQCQVQSEGLCNLGAQKHDTKIVVCPGTFKILRHWTVLDWCTNTVLEHDQLIKVVDNEGPAIATP
ncbi:MAG: proprotein convertase P-domain-containing protein, partial [Bacteroidetes bacterium]|nr:proprotein convertase P-domain-containing protein [Bacteroidota bacterium]